MTSEKAVKLVSKACTDLGVPYMVVGSVSSMFYGVARLTVDADFVVELGRDQLAALAKRLESRLRLQTQPKLESVTFTTRYLFEEVEGDFAVELFALSEDDFDQERFRRRVEVIFADEKVWLPTPEDVIVMKLRWYHHAQRTKDREDVSGIIAVRKSELDWDYIHRWCEIHGSREHLDAIRESLKRL